MFRLVVASSKLVAEHNVQHLTESRVFQLALSSSKLVAELDVHGRADARGPRQAVALTRVPRAERLPQPLRYHVEVGGTNVASASHDSFFLPWMSPQLFTRVMAARHAERRRSRKLQGPLCLKP